MNHPVMIRNVVREVVNGAFGENEVLPVGYSVVIDSNGDKVKDNNGRVVIAKI